MGVFFFLPSLFWFPELCLTQEAQEQIVKLFNIMDRNSDGVLSSDDFLYFRVSCVWRGAGGRGGGSFLHCSYALLICAVLQGEEKWRELRVQLDSSGDGVVTVEEVSGLVLSGCSCSNVPLTPAPTSLPRQFREGFKRHALKQPGDVLGLPAPDTALGVWLAEVR